MRRTWLALLVTGLAGALHGAGLLTLVDLVVVGGFALVLPAALGGRPVAWGVVAALAVVSFLTPTGPAALLATPALGLAAWTALGALRAAAGGRLERARVVPAVIAVDAVVATGALVQSRAGIRLLGTYEPIIELTAVHFTYAGSATVALAAAAASMAPARSAPAGTAALVLCATAPVPVALGFLTGSALLQVGGAVLMAAGVCLTAALQLAAAVRARSWTVTPLLVVSGLAVWIPMALAVAWAAGQHWDVPALSIPDMARTHGLANALAFVGCGLLARRLVTR